MSSRIQLRRGLSAEWTTANPILAEGEMGVELDTKKYKIGDGITQWVTLQYSTGTKADIGLGNVDNTSDMNKPISTAVQNYITDTGVLLSYKADTSSLATVATSGNYNDLINKPQLAGANWELFKT
jgi:hypothetical protein